MSRREFRRRMGIVWAVALLIVPALVAVSLLLEVPWPIALLGGIVLAGFLADLGTLFEKYDHYRAEWAEANPDAAASLDFDPDGDHSGS